MIQIQENTQADNRMEGWTDSFHRTTPATARSPTSTTAVDWQLKVKYTEYDVDWSN